jgi:hemerythrin-like metal-binding protein
MSIIQWRESYNTGVEQFDREHHKIVELIDVLFTSVRDKREGIEITEAIAELVEYTGYHFDNEEQAMKLADYPELEAHQEEHRRLKQQALEFQAIGQNIEREKVTEFYQFLRGWLIDHIVDCDKKYGEFLAKE